MTTAGERSPAAWQRAVFMLFASTLVAMTTSCSNVSEAPVAGARHAYTHPHELRMADIGEPSTLNPFLLSEADLAWLSELTMAWLVRFDHANRPMPELATVVPTLRNGGISADGKTLTYHLRRNVRWSDGAPFSADDVVFTTRLVLAPSSNVPSRDGWDRIVSIDEPDDHTVTYHLRRPYSPAIETFFAATQIPILPKHLLNGKNVNTDAYNALPVGIGPFVYTRWARGDRIEMAANPSYWRGRPKLDKIVYRVLPDRETIVNALRTGDVDLWPNVSAAYYPRLAALPSIRLLRQPSLRYAHMDFNITHAVVRDADVRRALMLGWDRRFALRTIRHGIGVLQDGVVSPASPFFDRSLGFTKYDPAAANALLDRDGWTRGSDGVRSKAGTRLSIELVSNVGSPDTDQQIELLRADWKKIGVALVRKNATSSILFAPYADGGIMLTGKFDVMFAAWDADPSGSLNSLFNCSQFPPAGQNVLHWCDTETSRALDDFQQTSEFARQKRDNDLVQQRVAAQTPTIVSFIYDDIYAYNSDLVGFRPNQLSHFDDVMKVDI